MSEDRMVDSEADDFVRSLLASARGDGMSAAKKRSLAVALGVGAAASTAAAAGKAGTAAAAGKAGTAAAAGKAGTAAALKAESAVRLAAVGKWVIGLAFTSAVVAGATKGAMHLRGRPASGPKAPLTRSEHEALLPPTPPAEEISAQRVGPGESPTASSLSPAEARSDAAPVALARRHPAAVKRPAPTAAAPDPGPSPLPPAPGPPAVDRSSLSDELRAIERARTALAGGELREAGRALDAYDAAFPSGSFGDESRVLRIELLARSGDRASAAERAREFLTARPRSPHAPRVRALRALLGDAP